MMNPIQSFFFFFLSLICSTLSSPTLQMDALLEFKNEFPFSAPNPNASFDFSFSWWNTSTNHCSWKGVTCNANSGAVISLVLEDIVLNGSLKANTSLLKLQHLQNLTLCNCILRGEIPSSLGNLSHLMQLDLFNNDLVGKIPSSLGSLSHLIQLDLSYNDLVGEIPSSLGNLSHLIELDLNSNSLIGEIPTSLGNLNQLTFMSFSSNNLTGHVPSSFANFNKLSNLDLSRNQFSGGDLPLILSNLTSLSELDLSSNHFKSKLPSNMSRLHNLKVFDVKRNYFLGNVPTSLFMIPMLLGVYLRGNQFEGPLEFGNTSASSRLVSLDLSSNNFHEPIPEDIFRFLKLETLDLSNNSFTGAISRSMSKLVSLRFLDLSYNKMEGQVPSFLWSLDTLTLSHNYFSSLEEVVVNGSHSDLSSNSLQVLVFKVDLGSNSLQGSFPLWICKSTLLLLLDLSNNHLSGSIPSCLMNSTVNILLRNNNLSGFLPDIFANATDVLYLDVSRNQLMGKLPKSLINCKYMHYLNLKGNKFNDTFPYWLGSLVSLRVLILGSNAFYGPVSSHVGFPSLKIIDISHNSFNGTLPQDYFVNWLEMSTVWVDYEGIRGSLYMGAINHTDSMDMMYKGVDTEFPLIFLGFKAIDFSGNKFTGRIPKSVGLLKDLRHVNFSRNAFTGSIPSSLAKLTNLEALDLSHNKLSGNIPRDLARLSFMSYMDFSHNLLQGPVPRSTQFQSQNCSSFEDNLGLYGLETICGPIHGPHPTPGDSHQSEEFSSEESEEVLSWIAAAIAFGPGRGFDLSAGEEVRGSSSCISEEKKGFVFEADFAKDKGARHSMEDVSVVLPDASLDFPGILRCGHFAIYDWHSGRLAAEFAKHLHLNVLSAGLPRELVCFTWFHILSRSFLDPNIRLLLQLDVKVAKKAILDASIDSELLTQLCYQVSGKPMSCSSKKVFQEDGKMAPQQCVSGLLIKRSGGVVTSNGRIQGRLEVSRAFGDRQLLFRFRVKLEECKRKRKEHYYWNSR
ncbi:hypothetical protein HID58_021800 [Brassica napus]|uniref:Leucine-rich repeat-containing N-terminal plant-type domain-containing protein n=1 Tax=Brassica napus TaxID=3708 RepID=A0ABQ8CXE3_BRANA|nr:hypothetical protein HID58_021800 [Brassica napus]